MYSLKSCHTDSAHKSFKFENQSTCSCQEHSVQYLKVFYFIGYNGKEIQGSALFTMGWQVHLI